MTGKTGEPRDHRAGPLRGLRPPRVATWLAVLRVPAVEREFAQGDLHEEFDALVRSRGSSAARRWYWRQAVQSALHGRPPSAPGSHARAPIRVLFTGWHQDLVQAWRRLLARPTVSLAALGSFALGLGANVAIFSVAWPVLVAPLPFPDEARLMKIALTFERNNATLQHPLSTGDYVDLHAASSFSQTAAFNKLVRQFNLTGHGDTEQITAGYVTPGVFPVLGVSPVLGRVFTAGDGRSARVMVLNERLWRSRFGADPAILGTVLRLDGVPFEVIGVVPASTGLGTVDVDGWLPQWIDLSDRRRGAYFLGMIGRLKPGVTRAQAQAELAAVMARAAIEFPQPDGDLGALVSPFRHEAAAPVRSTLVLLVTSAGLVLLVAIVNLAGLQLARDFERGREMAVRRALGASRWRLVRLSLAEAFTMAVAGGIAGTGVAWVVTAGLAAVAPSFGWQQHVPVSRGAVTAFALALTLVSGVAIALLPAWRASRRGSDAGWRSRAVTATASQARTRAAVVTLQVGMTAVLLVAAALVGVSQRNVLALDPGFDPGHTLAADLSVPAERFDNVRGATAFFDVLTTRIRALPAVSSACVANEVPLDREPGGMTYVAEGTTRLVSAWHNTITPECVDVLGLRLLAGRRVTNAEPTPSIMVSASMARMLFPDGRTAVGQRVHFGVPTEFLLTIVGVVGDVRDGTLERTSGRQVWMPQSLGHFPPKRLLVRYRSAGVMDVAALRSVVRDLAPDLALARPRSLTDVVTRATASRRFALFLLSGFAVIAVWLCAIGLYGLLAHAVGQRTQEIGIRMALGARQGQVLRLILGQVSLAVVVGLAAGLAGARAISGTVQSLLYGITATNPRVYVAVAATVLALATLAAWAPTRRAIRIDPRVAMRDL
jgi:putative ABC transport system permease protein